MPDFLLPPFLTPALADVSDAERAALERVWSLATPPAAPEPDPVRRDALWARIEAQRHAIERAPLPPRPARVPRRYEREAVPRRTLLLRRIAFALPVVAIVLALGWWWQRPVVLSARVGEPQTLADGSTVLLSPGALLSYERTSPREVQLTGEATFEVVRDVESPFTVLTSNARIEVLGTVFTVFAPNDNTTRVHVSRGRVAIVARRESAAAGTRTELSAGQRTQVDGARVAPPVAYDALTVGPIHVDGMPLGELFDNLGRRYGVVIRVPEPLRSRPWTLHLNGSPLLEDALNAVTLPNGLAWQRTQAGHIEVFER